MAEKSEENELEKILENLPLTAENTGYDKSEMISCQKCQRNNPPTRLDCLYCGIELEFDENQFKILKPVLRKPETHLDGFNLIYLANLKEWDEEQYSEVAKMTRFNKNELKQIVGFNKPLPIALGENEKETKIVSQRLEDFGIDSVVINDKDFEFNKTTKRLKRIEFDEDNLVFILFNNDEVIKVEKKEITLIVVGAIFEKRVESTEKYKKKEESKVLETSEISTDEIVFDIYIYDEIDGFRVTTKGFDFSSLGDEKKLLASENIQTLINKLKNEAVNAQFIDNYLEIRPALTNTWEVDEVKDSKGIKRKSFGSFNRQNVTMTSNQRQFTKYSRLQWLLLNKELM